MNKYDYITDIHSAKLNKDIKGFFSKTNIDILRSDYTTGKVLQGMEYRPDKVAAYYYGGQELNYLGNNESKSWIITLANGFINGISDYYLGRELIIPTEKAIMSLKKE